MMYLPIFNKYKNFCLLYATIIVLKMLLSSRKCHDKPKSIITILGMYAFFGQLKNISKGVNKKILDGWPSSASGAVFCYTISG